MTQPTPKEQYAPAAFLMTADSTKIRCVDEREAKDVINNGVAVPGGIYGVIDTIKVTAGVSEEAAWQMAQNAGIPIGGHMDEHHGPKGCGYGKLVETEPATVGATEAIPAEIRKNRIEQAHGELVTLLGDHHPTEAIINSRQGTTIDTKKASQSGRGIFDFDVWAMEGYAEKLQLDPGTFTSHMIDVYKKTVTKLTGITTFTEVK